MDKSNISDEERIAIGICISDRGPEHCKICIDSYDAHRFKIALKEELDKNKIIKP